MSSNLKVILKGLGYAMLVLFLINVIYLGIELSQTEFSHVVRAGFRNIAFSLNNKIIGFEIGTYKANLIFFIIFSYYVYKEYEKGNVSFKK